MKNFLNFAIYTTLLVIAISFNACQSEDPLATQINEEQTLIASSSTAQLLIDMVANDGSHDNIVDGSSCFDISFPYTVSINEVELTINSVDDLERIEELFDAFDYDDDILDIVFPITITKADYTEVVINNIEDLNEISTQCLEGGEDADIECIDIIYPVALYTYNPNLQQTATVVVNSDKDMRRFFAGLNETDLISIEFPVSFELYDGNKVTVNSNSELTNEINQAKELCDEDDDNDHSDDDFTLDSLDSLLLKCPLGLQWQLNGSVQLENYRGYYLVFSDTGEISAIDSLGVLITGEWSTHWIDNRVVLRLYFEQISILNNDWYVNGIEEGEIVLFTTDGIVKATVKSDCDYEVVICNEGFIKETMQNCKWAVSNGQDDSFLDGLQIDFSDMNIHVYNPNGTIVDEGNWEIKDKTLKFNDLSMELANYIGEWQVIECGLERLKIQRDEEYLILEKDCE